MTTSPKIQSKILDPIDLYKTFGLQKAAKRVYVFVKKIFILFGLTL